MSTEKTLSIIKPDAVKKNVIGKIISRFEENGLYLVAAKLIHLSDEKASGFYAEHIGKSFFKDLKKFMTSGPVFVQVLEGKNAVQKNRDLAAAADPCSALEAVFAGKVSSQQGRHGGGLPSSWLGHGPIHFRIFVHFLPRVQKLKILVSSVIAPAS